MSENSKLRMAQQNTLMPLEFSLYNVNLPKCDFRQQILNFSVSTGQISSTPVEVLGRGGGGTFYNVYTM